METVWSDRCSYFLDRKCKTCQCKSGFLCTARRPAVHRDVQMKLLPVHASATTYISGCGNSKVNTIKSKRKGVSLGSSQYWGFGKLRAEDINSIFWHTIPRVSVITACRRQFWAVNLVHIPQWDWKECPVRQPLFTLSLTEKKLFN